MKDSKLKFVMVLSAFCVLHFAFFSGAKAQETPPAPSAPKSVNVPAVKERRLKNNLTVAVVERKSVPLVTVQLLVRSGAELESLEKAGLANLTASLLTKGTKTRSATQVAEQIEFLGGTINSGAGWNNSFVTINVMADKLEQAMAVMSDVALNPTFAQDELDLLKSQTLDSLTYNLKQPGFLANYVASAYSYGEHPAGGTPDSLNRLNRNDILAYHAANYNPRNTVLIFTGDITDKSANSLAQKYFGKWKNPRESRNTVIGSTAPKSTVTERNTSNRILVVDLPNSGQAAVNYVKSLQAGRILCTLPTKCETADFYYPAIVLNSVLGGGYSSRLNQEIRIKRGLSYGAGSSFAWRGNKTNFGTRTQTKNESAPEVAELVLAEVKKLTEDSIADAELIPRKSVLTGTFGRNLETTEGLAAAVADLYTFGLPTGELNSFMNSVQAVRDAQIRDFANRNLPGGDIIIVGDSKIFMDELKKRFPETPIQIVNAGNINLSSNNLN